MEFVGQDLILVLEFMELVEIDFEESEFDGRCFCFFGDKEWQDFMFVGTRDFLVQFSFCTDDELEIQKGKMIFLRICSQ